MATTRYRGRLLQCWIGLDAQFRVRWVMMRVGSINAVKLVEASDLVAILDEVDGRGIGDMDGDDQERVKVQSGGLVIVKSRHGRLRERIDGGATSFARSVVQRTSYDVPRTNKDIALTPYLSKKAHQNGDLTPSTQNNLIGTKCHI
eukprot:scaffold168544_cov43-Attheya_sp.AAC.1